MGEENLAAVRRSTDAYNRRDLEGTFETWAPDAVLDWSRSRGPDAGVYRGLDAIQEFWRRFIDTWEEVRVELHNPVEIDPETLIVENVTYLRGRDNVETQARSAWLITFRDGKQTSFTLYQTMQDALDATPPSE